MIYGAILAGGTGKRIERYSIPKQFITIGGVPIIVLTLREFLKNEKLDYIYIAVHHDWVDYATKLLNSSFTLDENKKMKIVEGGKERVDSFNNILIDIEKNVGLKKEDILICHDSVRPFVRQQMIDDCIDKTLKNDFALTVVPVTDTVFVSKEEQFLTGTLDRSTLSNGQTPSGFNALLLKKILTESSKNEKDKSTGTMQLVLNAGYKIAKVQGHTSNFKITTDNDLDVADKILSANSKTRETLLLDCTLRDGGIVIDFDFGTERMQEIKKCLEDSNVNYIECGYINGKKGAERNKTCFSSEVAIRKDLLCTGKKDGVQYVAMIDYGTYDVNRLEPRNKEGIDGIRLAFHKENWKDSINLGKIIIKKGYDLYIQPMVTSRYSYEEFRELMSSCNKELSEAKGFYIVDSFGQMNNSSLVRMLAVADQYIDKNMIIGFHAHNNRQMAFSNASSFVEFPFKHKTMLDSSIMGMGKGAGNLCTELIIPILISKGGKYNSNSIYDIIHKYFSKVFETNPWGYSLDYYLSSLYSCTPSYIKIFKKDTRVNTDVLIELLKNMPEEKKYACDKVFAEKYISEYFSNTF